LHRTDDKDIGRKELEMYFGIGITLHGCQVSGAVKFKKRLLIISSKTT